VNLYEKANVLPAVCKKSTSTDNLLAAATESKSSTDSLLIAIVAAAELAAGVGALSADPGAAAVVDNEKALSSSLTAVEAVLLACTVLSPAVVPGRTK
jgi:hypothetical protein